MPTSAPSLAALSLTEFAGMIVLTDTRPDLDGYELAVMCRWAMLKGIAAVCVHPRWVSSVVALLSGSNVKVCAAMEIPDSLENLTKKSNACREAIAHGAQEIVWSLRTYYLKSGRTQLARLEPASLGLLAAEYLNVGFWAVIDPAGIEERYLSHAFALLAGSRVLRGAGLLFSSDGGRAQQAEGREWRVRIVRGMSQVLASNQSSLEVIIFGTETYAELHRLYEAGARRFVVERAPLVQIFSEAEQVRDE